MTEVASRQATRRTALVLATSLFVACDSAQEPAGLRLPSAAMAGKVSGVTVTAASPSFGKQGQTNEAVTITGSGFATDAQASWLRNGVVDTTITVISTQVVSSTTLIATITISPKSPVDFRDVRVTRASVERRASAASCSR